MTRSSPPRASKIKLDEVATLTFFQNERTTSRRKPSVSQLACQGPGCKHYQPDVVQCANVGGSPPDWACHAELPAHLRMGRVTVSCEGWTDRPDDPYVVRGSCGLEYRLISLDASGHEASDSTSSLIPMLAVLLALFLIYRTFFRSPRGPWAGHHGNDGPGGPFPPWNPHHRPGDGDDDDGTNDAPPPYSKFTQANARQRQGPGFWTGVGAGVVGGVAAQRYFGGRRTQANPEPLGPWDRHDRIRATDDGHHRVRVSTGYGVTRNR